MKSLVKATVLGLALASTLANAKTRHQEEEKAPVQTINLDWNDKRTLSDSIVMMCDDTVLSAVEIVIPGKPFENFSVDMVADVTNGKPDIGCSIKKTEGKNSTTYSFDAVGGGCDIRVHKVRKDFKEKPQSAEYSISDAC